MIKFSVLQHLNCKRALGEGKEKEKTFSFQIYSCAFCKGKEKLWGIPPRMTQRKEKEPPVWAAVFLSCTGIWGAGIMYVAYITRKSPKSAAPAAGMAATAPIFRKSR